MSVMNLATWPMDMARTRLGSMLRGVLQGEPLPPEWLAGTGGDLGLFGPGSATWQVHGDPAMIVGGVRALMLQTLHPLAMAGVADHSDYRHDPLGRLHRTAGFIGMTTFGTTATAELAIEQVKAIHTTVSGIAPDGRRYAAGDPDLLTWVHVALVDSILAGYRRYGSRRLTAIDVDRYLDEYSIVAERLGARDVPKTGAALQQWLRDIRPELRAGRQAGETVRFLLNPPLPFVIRPPYALVAAAAVGLLPGWARRMVGLPTVPVVDRVAVRPAMGAMLRTAGWVLGPPPVPVAA
jgi:uncharacterized protein (DUF2236 family)